MANLFVFSHSRRRRSFTSLTIAVFMVLWSGTCCTQSTASSSCELSASRFFEAGEYLHTVALASYPRSGNSFLRALLERATGFVTCARGSDPKLMALGFRGHRIDPLRPEQRHLCLVHKTHFPMNMQQLAQDLELFPGDDGAYSGAFDRVLMLVRNPFDVAFSSFHYFGPNNSHSSRRLLPDGSVEPLPSATARVHAAMWAKHVKFWLDRTSATVPSNVSSQASGHVASQDRLDSSRTEIGEDRFPERLIVRYEDLKKNPGHYIHAIAHWLGLSELNNDRVECTLSLKNNMVYQSANHTPFHSLAHMEASTQSQLVQLASPELLCGLGYANDLEVCRAECPCFMSLFHVKHIFDVVFNDVFRRLLIAVDSLH